MLFVSAAVMLHVTKANLPFTI